MRQSTLAITSLALVAVAGAAVADAAAQTVPVSYHTDPGPAHPRYANTSQTVKVVGQAAIQLQEPVAPITMASAAAGPYAQDAIVGISTRRTVQVQEGDTVYALGRAYNVRPSDIIAINELSAPYALNIGDELTIPGPTAAQQPVAQPISAAAPAPAPAPIAQQVAYPVTERLDGIYTVKPGDTLYSLSRQFDIDLKILATANQFEAPYGLSINQRIVIPGSVQTYAAPAVTQVASPVARPAPVPVQPTAPVMTPSGTVEPILISKTPESRFAWPLRGSVIMTYGMSQGGVKNDGINIAAPVGAPVRASADGEVVYTGSELAGYGNLLLVRHEDGWVSAYAHTDTILVQKGQRVQQGQVVAKVGNTGNVEQSQLHFELRHELMPQDPLAALNGTHHLAAAKGR